MICLNNRASLLLLLKMNYRLWLANRHSKLFIFFIEEGKVSLVMMIFSRVLGMQPLTKVSKLLAFSHSPHFSFVISINSSLKGLGREKSWSLFFFLKMRHKSALIMLR
jgi:hypothetical protein